MAWDVPSFYIPVNPNQGGQIASYADRLLGAYDQGQASRRQQDVLNARRSVGEMGATNPDGSPNYQSMAERLLGAGDIEGANTFMRLGQQQEDRNYRRSRDTAEDTWRQQQFGFQQQQAAAQNARADKGLSLQEQQIAQEPPKTTTTYDERGQEQRAQWNPVDQKWEPIGGPKQPNRPPLPSKTVGDLTSAGEAVTTQDRLGSGFRPDYAGQPVLGEFWNMVGRNWGGSSQPQAEWWQDYQRQRNQVRNQLFGSALTATEKAEFDKADINPGMSPDVIRANLERQRSASVRAAKKLAETYIRMNYDPAVIEAAIGIPLAELGVGAIDPNSSKDQARMPYGTAQSRAAQNPPAAAPQPAQAAMPGGAPASPPPPANQIPEGTTATNPSTGQKLQFRSGQWVPM